MPDAVKVYLVDSGRSMSEDYRVHGIFSTRALADAYVAKEDEKPWSERRDLAVQEWTLDTETYDNG